MRAPLSSALDAGEAFLEHAGFDRGPWLVVAFAAGIAAWFVLAGPFAWLLALALAAIVALGALALWRGVDHRGRLMQACVVLALAFALGVALIWARSALMGQPGIERPLSGTFTGRVLEREEQPAEGRVRLTMAMREPESGRAIKVRINVPLDDDDPALREGAVTRFSARLMPPAPPMLPGAYNFARTAWFQGLAATGIAIIALHEAQPVRDFLKARDETWLRRTARRLVMLLITGFVIELALMPIVMFHFHRAGVYGALANVIGIPLVTFVAMPMIAVALTLDVVGLGAPAWWVVGQSLDLLLAIARFTAEQPGAVKLMPQMTGGTYALFIAGGLWLALWRGRKRLLGVALAMLAAVALWLTPIPDLLVSGDGRHVGITGEGEPLLVLRESRSAYTRDNLLELAGVDGEPVPLDTWPGAQCSTDFCVITLHRGGRDWHITMSRNRQRVEERALAAACERADIVISERWLPRTCQPRWLKADRSMLEENGGLSIVLGGSALSSGPILNTVAASEGEHGWWRGRAED